MKKLNLKLLLILLVGAVTFYGCLDNGKSATVSNADKVLTDKHSGWGVIQCFSCHDVVTLLSTDNLATIHEPLVSNRPQTLDTSVCLSCHGLNGVENVVITGCSNCHSATATVATAINPLFLNTHDNASLSATGKEFLRNDNNCSTCHNISGHPSTTTLDIASPACLNCHAGYETTIHKAVADCKACHTTAEFTRGQSNLITGHIATVNLIGSNCLTCHNNTFELPANRRFTTTHKTSEALTVANCLSCHSIDLGHFTKTTDLRVIADLRCLYCHTESSTITHFNDPTCSMCHTVRGFNRDVTTSNIAGHNSNSTSCVNCHSRTASTVVPRYLTTHIESASFDLMNCIKCHNLNITGHFGKDSLLKSMDPATCFICHTAPTAGGVHDTLISDGYGVCANAVCHKVTGYVRDANGVITGHNK